MDVAALASTLPRKPKKLKKKKGFMLKLNSLFGSGQNLAGSSQTYPRSNSAPATPQVEHHGPASPIDPHTPSLRKPKMAGKRKKKKMKFKNPSPPATGAAGATYFVDDNSPKRQYKKTGYKASDLKMNEQQRIQVMNLVKSGKMTVNEAMDAVMEREKAVEEFQKTSPIQEVENAKKKEFKKSKQAFSKNDIAALSPEQRIQVMMLVKDQKMSVDQAVQSVQILIEQKKSQKNSPNSSPKIEPAPALLAPSVEHLNPLSPPAGSREPVVTEKKDPKSEKIANPLVDSIEDLDDFSDDAVPDEDINEDDEFPLFDADDEDVPDKRNNRELSANTDEEREQSRLLLLKDKEIEEKNAESVKTGGQKRRGKKKRTKDPNKSKKGETRTNRAAGSETKPPRKKAGSRSTSSAKRGCCFSLWGGG
mmetsp:Transcript_20403/g.39431  ORF Transcript_20403/g.39431 Transcript_20403/m.39431 type:complete len:420 (+) Transcript_20403:93-1352(+)